MALSLGALVALGATAAVSGYIGSSSLVDHFEDDGMYKAYQTATKRLNQTLSDAGITFTDVVDTYDYMYNNGYVDSDTYQKGVDALNTLKKEGYSKSAFNNLTRDQQTQVGNIINYMNANVPAFNNALKVCYYRLSGDAKAAFANSLGPVIAPTVVSDAPAPSYESVGANPTLDEVEPVKWWTGQELADLHNIDFNPDSYYDLIKQGTSANVDLARYQSAQANEAADINNTDTVTSYLDALRNNKAESISKGATLGAKMANDLLASTETYNTYATNQNELAQNRLELMSNPLLEDAQARVAARDYFTKLAEGLGTDSTSLYYNDSLRYGQDWMNAATKYAADQSLRGQRAYANGQMYSNYLQAQANIDNARATMQNTYNKAVAGNNELINQYNWLYDRALEATKGNPYEAGNLTDNYLFSLYSNYRDPANYVSALYKSEQN